MLYNYRGETFKLKKSNSSFKLYHNAINNKPSGWNSSGWTYIGTFKTELAAQAAARRYTL